MKTVGVKALVTMSRILYIDVPDDATEEQIKKEAEQEIILPFEAMYRTEDLLKNLKINSKFNLKDWSLENSSFETIK